jgi:hypothetical protein
MQYDRLLASSNMDATAKRCLSRISAEDATRFVTEFQNPNNQDWQITHTYRELILGTYLRLAGFDARYSVQLDSQEPDWSILDENSKPRAIAEVASLHAPIDVENLTYDLHRGFWGENDNTDRLYSRLQGKITKYKDLVENRRLAFVVAIFSQNPAFVQLSEFQACLQDENSGLFKAYPMLSGAILFQEGTCRYDIIPYRFDFLRNPEAQLEFGVLE